MFAEPLILGGPFRELVQPHQRQLSGVDRLSELTAEHLRDQPSVAKIAPHRLTDDERAEIIAAADGNSDRSIKDSDAPQLAVPAAL
jgi:hypothetical protein